MEKQSTKKLKVFGVHWHTTHQHELAKLPFFETYDLIINPYRMWGDTHRPFPEKCKEVDHYEPGYYDFAILHVDQQCIYNPEENDRISKGRLYAEINEVIQDIPKIVINHMTPFHDKYDSDKVVEEIKRMVGDNYMVCNSYEAAEQWGWGDTIIHGMDIDEWWDLPKEPRCVVALSQRGMDRAYRREYLLAVRRLLLERGVVFKWIGVDDGVRFKTFDEYRDYLGRSLVYFNPTWQSPRPRARTEAMLSGCCVVTTPYQDASTYFEEGVNGFLTSKIRAVDPRLMDSPEYAADLIQRLIEKDPDEAIRIGQEGKKTAQKLFNSEAFANQWEALLRKLKIWK